VASEVTVRLRLGGLPPDETYLEMDLLGVLEDLEYPIEDVEVVSVEEV